MPEFRPARAGFTVSRRFTCKRSQIGQVLGRSILDKVATLGVGRRSIAGEHEIRAGRLVRPAVLHPAVFARVAQLLYLDVFRIKHDLFATALVDNWQVLLLSFQEFDKFGYGHVICWVKIRRLNQRATDNSGHRPSCLTGGCCRETQITMVGVKVNTGLSNLNFMLIEPGPLRHLAWISCTS